MSFLSVRGVSKYFGARVGVTGVDLDIERGRSVALFGPNGSGKTTLLRLLATLSRPSEGTISIAGVELSQDNPGLRSQIGVVSHDTYLYDDLTARENLQFHARLHGVDPAACERALEAVGLADRGADRAGEFSHGMAKRLALARATLHDPDLLLLDEPFSGLDRDSLSRIDSRLREMNDTALVIATHDIESGFGLADRVLLLSEGRLVGDVETADCAGPTDLERRYDDLVHGGRSGG
jgi:heme exporter protein A